jgi:hypothetical protein
LVTVPTDPLRGSDLVGLTGDVPGRQGIQAEVRKDLVGGRADRAWGMARVVLGADPAQRRP